MTALQPLLALVACALILWRVEPALNRMACGTRFSVRVALYLVAVGASGQALRILLGHVPDWPTVLLLAGVAALLLCERRLRVLVPPPRADNRTGLAQ